MNVCMPYMSIGVQKRVSIDKCIYKIVSIHKCVYALHVYRRAEEGEHT